MDYEQRREAVWPFKQDWGTEDERQAVRDYLKREWQKNNSTHNVAPSLENTRNEAREILEWWWQNRYNQMGSRDLYNYPEYFGRWLLQQYREEKRLDPSNNIVPGPR